MRKTKKEQRSYRGLTLILVSFLVFMLYFGFTEANEYTNSFGSGRKLLQTTGTVNGNADWLHSLPRKTLNGTVIEDPSVFLVEGLAYYSSLAGILIFTIAVGILAIFVGISFCCCRYFCDLCGGKEPRDSGYSKAERNVVKALLIIDVLLFVALIVIGCIGNAAFAPGLNNFFANVEAGTPDQAALLRSIEPRLLSVTNRTNLKGYVSALTGDANQTEASTESAKSVIGSNDAIRLSVLGITYGIIALAGLLGVIAAIANIPRLSMLAAGFGFFAFFLCWLNLAIHFPVSVMVSDLCYDIKVKTLDGIIQTRTDRISNPDGAINLLIHCPNVNNSIRTYGWAQQLINESMVAQVALLTADGGNLTLNDSLEYNRLESQINFLAVIQQDVLFIRDCRWLEYTLNPIADDICDKYLNGLIYIWGVSVTHSLLLIPFIVLAIVGFKRFTKVDAGAFF